MKTKKSIKNQLFIILSEIINSCPSKLELEKRLILNEKIIISLLNELVCIKNKYPNDDLLHEVISKLTIESSDIKHVLTNFVCYSTYGQCIFEHERVSQTDTAPVGPLLSDESRYYLSIDKENAFRGAMLRQLSYKKVT